MPEYAGHKMSKKDLKNFHKDMKDMAKKEKPMSEKEMNDMAKEYNKEAMEVYTNYLDEISKKTLHSYVKKAREDSKERTADLHHLYHHTDGNYGDTADRFGGMHASGHDKLDNRNTGIQRAADRMADKKYGKAKPGKKTKLSKPLRVHPDDKPSTYHKESQDVQEISKGVLNRYQGMRRNDHDILGSRAAYHHQRAMDHGQGNYYGGGEKGKDKAAAHKEIAKDGDMSHDKAKKAFKKVGKHRAKESDYEAQRHTMDKGIDRAFKRLASDKYGKAKPGQKTKLAKDVKESMKVYTSYLDELKTSTLTSYKKKAKADKERLSDRADYLVQRDGPSLGGRYAMADADNAADKYERAERREKGIEMAKKKINKKKVDSAPRLTKEAMMPGEGKATVKDKKLRMQRTMDKHGVMQQKPPIKGKVGEFKKIGEAKANPKDYYEVSGTKLTKQLMDKLVKARKKEMNDKKVLKGTPVHYEEYGAGFMGTDALRKKYENETPGQNTNPYKLAVDGVPTKDGIKKPMVETKGAPKGYHFTRSGKLRKGDANQDGPGGKMLRSDPLDKQRSKIPPLPEEVNKKDEKGLKKLSDMLKGSAGAHLDQKKKLDKLIANEEKFKVKNCGCDKEPCETYGSKEEQMKAHMEGYMGDQIKDRIKSKLHPDRMERNKAARRADTRKHNRQVVQSAIKSEIGRMMQNKEKKMDEGLIIERIKISAVTPKGRKTYRYAGTPVDAQKKVAQLRKSGHASISTVEEEYVSEGKMKDLYMKKQAEAEKKKQMQKPKPKKEPNKIMKDIGYTGRMANEENLNELDTDTIKSAYDKRKKQAFDHEYAASDHMSSAEHAKTKAAEKTQRSFAKQRRKMHDKASKGVSLANRALKRKGYMSGTDYRLQKGGEDDRYEDERKGRLKENYRRQTGYRKPANWKTNANHLVGQKGNNLTKGRNMVYLLKYLISRSGLAK